MKSPINFSLGRMRAWFDYERFDTDIDFVMNELSKNKSINAVYNDEDCIIMVETIDEKYTRIEDLILLVDGIIVKMRNGKNV